jgi:hypothetical protein
MERMDQPEIEIINAVPHDDYRQHSPRRDRSEAVSPRRPSQRVDDELSREFQRLSIGENKDKDKNRRKVLSVEPGKITRRQSSSGGKQHPQYFELYRFNKYGKDWTVVDRIRITAPQDELEKKVVKGKSRIPIVDTMINMPPIRRGQVNRLLDIKNNDEKDKDAEWVPVLIEKKNGRGKSARSVLSMDVIIARTFKPGGSGPREKRFSFAGEKSDLRVPLTSKSKDNSKDKDKDKFNGVKGNDRDQYRERDFFAEQPLFTNDGRPIDDQGRPFDGHKGDRRPIPLENPIAGPIQALQPLRQAPGGWNEPLPPPPFPHDDHHNQPPIEIINSGQPGNCLVDLEQILDKSNGGGGGGHANQNFEEPRLNAFAGAGEVGIPPLDGAGRRRSSGGRRRSGSRPRPTRIYTDQGRPRRSYRRADQYGDSSIDDPDEAESIFFYGDDGSSISSYSADHDRIEERGSLKRRPSDRRGEHFYREHRRRPASYYPGRSGMILEPARTPRRPRMERRQTIAYHPVSRQITYPYEGGRRRSDPIDEPLSPVLTRRGDSPGFPRRKESRGPLPELLYPDELGEKDRAPDDYADHMRREHRFREDDLRRQERVLDERDAIKGRGGSKGYYRDLRDGWDRR